MQGRRLTSEDLNIHSEIMQELTGQREVFSQVTDILRSHLLTSDTAFTVGGTAKLLSHPEYSDVERARDMLQLLDSGSEIGSVLKESGWRGNEGFHRQRNLGSSRLNDCAR